MLYALLASLVCSTIIVICLVGINDRQRRAHARREDLLLNQLLHAVGKTWEEPPSAEPQVAPREPSEVRVLHRSPEMLQPLS